MKQTYLKKDGHYYAGTSTEREATPALPTGLSSGWHNHMGQQDLDALIWQDTPYDVGGVKSLTSAMQKVMERIQAGVYPCPIRLEIEIVEELN